MSSVKAPLDVVLVLDISGSMSVKGDGKRIDHLVSAVNNTITYLMQEDNNNRVAVVAYNNCATKICHWTDIMWEILLIIQRLGSKLLNDKHQTD